MEDAARRISRHLYEDLRAPDGGPACPLVRCCKTHPHAALPPALRRFADAASPDERPGPRTRCLTLPATVGDRPAWNARQQSAAHQAIPLVSTRMVEHAPMVAQLVRAFGLDPADVVRPSEEVVHALRGRTCGVFHVPEAAGSPHIPAQREFVEPHGICSVVGFGGTLPDGELFAVILFGRVPIDESVADRFRNVALDVKGALMRFDEDTVFDAELPPAGEVEAPVLRG